jgi:hypothetical protein
VPTRRVPPRSVPPSGTDRRCDRGVVVVATRSIGRGTGLPIFPALLDFPTGGLVPLGGVRRIPVTATSTDVDGDLPTASTASTARSHQRGRGYTPAGRAADSRVCRCPPAVVAPGDSGRRGGVLGANALDLFQWIEALGDVLRRSVGHHAHQPRWNFSMGRSAGVGAGAGGCWGSSPL